MTDILNFISSSLIPALASVGLGAGWLFDRWMRKGEMERIKSENKATEAGALRSMQSVYDKFVDDVKNQMSELKHQIADLHAENKELKNKISVLERSLAIAEKKLKEYAQ